MILLNLDDGKIKGDSAVDGYEDWITLDSVQFGVGRAISTSGTGKDRDTSNPSFSEITITKSTDTTSGELFQQSCGGKAMGKAELVWIQTGGTDEGNQPYLTIELTDPIISSYSISSGGERPNESVSLNFTKIKFRYDAFDGAKITKGRDVTWDLMTNKKH